MHRAALAIVLLAALAAPVWADEAERQLPSTGEQAASGATSSETPPAAAPAGDCGCSGPGGGCCGRTAAAPAPDEAPRRGCACGMKKRDASPPAP